MLARVMLSVFILGVFPGVVWAEESSSPKVTATLLAPDSARLAKVSREECDKAVAGKLEREGGVWFRYAVMDKAVYHYTMLTHQTGSDCSKITDADPKTFSLLAYPGGSSWGDWAKDNYHVYYEGKTLPNADAETFQLFNDYWGKDGNHVYYKGNQVLEADAATFHVITGKQGDFFPGYEYILDKNHFYSTEHNSSSDLIDPKIDAATFEVLPAEVGAYVKDKNAVFFDNSSGLSEINGADPATFKVLGPCYSDKGMVYGSYAKDKNQVYCGDEPLEGADRDSFEYVGGLLTDVNIVDIAKDKQCLWAKGRKVLDKKGRCVKPSICTLEAIKQYKENSDDTVCGFDPYDYKPMGAG